MTGRILTALLLIVSGLIVNWMSDILLPASARPWLARHKWVVVLVFFTLVGVMAYMTPLPIVQKAADAIAGRDATPSSHVDEANSPDAGGAKILDRLASIEEISRRVADSLKALQEQRGGKPTGQAAVTDGNKASGPTESDVAALWKMLDELAREIKRLQGLNSQDPGVLARLEALERSYRELEARLQMVQAADRSAVSRRDPSPHPEPSRAPGSVVVALPKSSMPAPAEDEAPPNPPSGSIDPPAADARPATPRDEGSATAAARGAEAPPPAAPRDGPTGTIDQTAKAAPPGNGAPAPTAPVGLRILGAPPSKVGAGGRIGQTIADTPMFGRRDPSTSPIRVLPTGTNVRVTATESDWYEILLQEPGAKDARGYVAKAALRIVEPIK